MEPHTLSSRVEHLVRSGDWQAAVALIEERWHQVSGKEPSEMLLALHHLPAAALLARPDLAVMAPQIAVGSADEDDAGAAGSRRAESSAALLARLGRLTRRSQHARDAGKTVTAARLAQDARNALAEHGPKTVLGLELPLAALIVEWGSSLEAGGFTNAATEYERAYKIAHAYGAAAVARRAASNAAWLHAEIGDTATARSWVTRARSHSGDSPNAVADLADAVLHIDANDHATAGDLLVRAEIAGVGEHWAAALWVRSLLAHDVEAAAITENKIEHRIHKHPWLLSDPGFDGRLTRAARARALILRGRIDPETDAYAVLSYSDHVVAAALSYIQGDAHRALTHAGPVTEEALEPRLQSNALLVEAAAALALRRRKTAVTSFQRAEAIIQHHGLHANYQTISHADLDQLIALADADTENTLRVHPVRRDLPTLSRRENDVLAMLATDLSMDEIAERLFISKNTLKTTTRRLYRRLGVNTRADAVHHAHSDPRSRSADV